MDELLDVADILLDIGGMDAAVWLFRLLGAVAVLGGLGLWLLTGELLLVPVLLLLLGLVLLVVPQVVVFLVELVA